MMQDLENVLVDKAGISVSGDVDFGIHQLVSAPDARPGVSQTGSAAEPLYAWVARVQRLREQRTSILGKRTSLCAAAETVRCKHCSIVRCSSLSPRLPVLGDYESAALENVDIMVPRCHSEGCLHAHRSQWTA
jgi:hypothetical protein